MVTKFLKSPKEQFTRFTSLVKTNFSRWSQHDYASLFQQYYERLLRSVRGYREILLDRDGTILSWNRDHEVLEGYSESEILGQSFALFYLPEERQAHLPEKLIETACTQGKAIHYGKHVRKDGSTFYGSIQLIPIKNSRKEVLGFTEITRIIPDNESD